MDYVMFGERVPKAEIISGSEAAFLVWFARHSRLARVKRRGRRGRRGWIMKPRNPQEQQKRRSLLR